MLEGEAADVCLVALDRCFLVEWRAGAVPVPQVRKLMGKTV